MVVGCWCFNYGRKICLCFLSFSILQRVCLCRIVSCVVLCVVPLGTIVFDSSNIPKNPFHIFFFEQPSIVEFVSLKKILKYVLSC